MAEKEPVPDLPTLVFSLMDWLDQLPANLALQALANAAGGIIVNCSDNLIEAHDTHKNVSDMIRDVMRRNWLATKTLTGEERAEPLIGPLDG